MPLHSSTFTLAFCGAVEFSSLCILSLKKIILRCLFSFFHLFLKWVFKFYCWYIQLLFLQFFTSCSDSWIYRNLFHIRLSSLLFYFFCSLSLLTSFPPPRFLFPFLLFCFFNLSFSPLLDSLSFFPKQVELLGSLFCIPQLALCSCSFPD